MMRGRGFLLIAVFLLLAGCNFDKKEEEAAAQYSAETPEEVMKLVEEDEKRDFTIFGTHQVDDRLAFVVFKGFMNEKDIWIAEIEKENGQWITKKFVLMEFPQDHEQPITYTDSDTGYEAGYINDSTELDTKENTKVINLDDDSEWKIWLKYFGTTISS
jgi:hypothetical protein